ncbi:MAG: lysylphosphatidylglycerol synthase domain-containing protein, partial [bacterium]
SYLRVLRVYVVGWSSFLALPGSAGDAVQILLLKDADVPYRQGAAVYFADKLVTLGVNLVLVAAGGWLFLRDQVRSDLIVAFVLIVALAAGAILVWLRHSGSRFAGRATHLLAGAVGYGRRHPHRLAANAAGTVLKSVLNAACAWILFLGLGAHVSLAEVVVAHHAAALVAYLPVAFNGVGTVELAALGLYGELGVSSPKTLAMYLVLRALIVATALAALACAVAAGRRRRSRDLPEQP